MTTYTLEMLRSQDRKPVWRREFATLEDLAEGMHLVRAASLDGALGLVDPPRPSPMMQVYAVEDGVVRALTPEELSAASPGNPRVLAPDEWHTEFNAPLN